MDCTDKRVIHTIGHSTRSIEAFAGLLRAHDIHLVLDVRRWRHVETAPALQS